MGERIKAAREAAGLTQQQLAERVESAQQNVAKWESGLANPKPAQMVALVRELAVTADHLLGLGEEPPPVSVERAINQDQRLTDDARKFLLASYRAALKLPGASS